MPRILLLISALFLLLTSSSWAATLQNKINRKLLINLVGGRSIELLPNGMANVSEYELSSPHLQSMLSRGEVAIIRAPASPANKKTIAAQPEVSQSKMAQDKKIPFPSSPPQPPSQPADTNTAGLWNARCAACHGKDGKGNTSQGRQMGCSDISSASWQKSVSDARIKDTILNGRDKNGKKQLMPAYANKLHPEQIDSLVTFIRTFK